MRLQRFGALLGVERAHRDPAKPETAEQIADRAFGQIDAPLLRNLAGQIDAPPADHPVCGKLWTRLHPPGHYCRLLLTELWCRTRCPLVAEPGEPQGIVAVHPRATRWAFLYRGLAND